MKLQLEIESPDVDQMMQAALRHAGENGWAVAVAICDAGGHLLAFKRMDGVATLSTYVAIEKAKSATLGKRETANFERQLNDGRFSYLSIPVLKAHMEGGIPVLHEGRVLGAVGVSGVKSAEDAQIARVAIQSLIFPLT